MDDAVLGETIDAAEFTRRLHDLVPLARQLGIRAQALNPDGSARVALPYAADNLRPGGSISGPALMALADVAMFAGVNGRLGWTPMALTATQNTTFLKPPKPEDLVADAQPLRFGRRLVFFAVSIACASDPETPVAHATGSYALPQ